MAAVRGQGGPPRAGDATAVSAAQRCPDGPLSVVLSFLDSRSFGQALTVSRRFHAAAKLKSAWPVFDLKHAIAPEEEENASAAGDWRRRVRIDDAAEGSVTSRGLRGPIFSNATSALLAPCDVLLSPEERQARDERADDRLLQLRQLTVLDWTASAPDSASLALLAESDQLSARLKALTLRRGLFYSGERFPLESLGRLRHLRVLAVEFCPPVEQLQLLTSLQFLRVDHSECLSPDLTRVVRYLSTQHALTGARLRNWNAHPGMGFARAALSSLTTSGDLLTESEMFETRGDVQSPDDWQGVYVDSAAVSLPADAAQPMPPAALEEFVTDHECSFHEFKTVCAMPRLRRLTIGLLLNGGPALVLVGDSVHQRLSQLRRLDILLRLTGDALGADGHLPFLEFATGLRSLSLEVRMGPSFHKPSHLGLVDLGVFLPRMSGLEHLALTANISDACWPALARLPRLRQLKLRSSLTPDLELVAPHLARLPRFHTLEVTITKDHAASYTLPPSLLRHMCESSAWRTLIAHSRSHRRCQPWSIRASGAAIHPCTLPDSPAVQQLRVHLHANEESVSTYRITLRPDGLRDWVDASLSELV